MHVFDVKEMDGDCAKVVNLYGLQKLSLIQSRIS